MKRNATIAALLVLMLGTVAMAMQGAEGQTFMGEVTSVDAEAQTLTVQAAVSETEAMTFKVDEQTTIQGEGAELSLADIEAGQHVTISYVESEGEYVARTIEVQAEPTT